MKAFLASIRGLVGARVHRADALHNDSLRANQGLETPSITPWRAFFGG